jgi:glycosyltransferase involved in cell wall biosynthesis
MVAATLSRTSRLSKPEMQLLVFAHTPPPVHGQSLMVQTLVAGLGVAAPEIRVFHVNARLSNDAADIGRRRPGKVLSLVRVIAQAWSLRLRHGPMSFYYVPAPAKRGAFYRDLLVMLLCRPFFAGVILHWHAVGLGEWLHHTAAPWERWLAQRLLGGVDLAVVLDPALADDARVLRPQRITVVANGLDVPEYPLQRRRNEDPPPVRTEVLFLGLCSEEKGLFDTVEAVAQIHQHAPGSVRLTVAGAFPDREQQQRLKARMAALGPDVLRHVGFASGEQKHALLSAADVFCFPTKYSHEGQPLSLIEALAYDLPIVTTRWRAIPGMLPVMWAGCPHPAADVNAGSGHPAHRTHHVELVEPNAPAQIAEAISRIRRGPGPNGSLHAHYLAHFTRERHLASLAAALQSTK